MITRVAPSIAVGLGGALLLWLTYRTLAITWPNSYFSLSDIVNRRIAVSPVSYAVFRFVPVIVATGLVAVTVERLGGYPPVAATVIGAVHATESIGRRLWILVQRDTKEFARRSQIAYLGGIGIGLAASVVVGVLLADTSAFKAVIPELNELRSGLWTAVFAALLATLFIRVVYGSEVSPNDVLRQSRRTAGASLCGLVRSTALNHGVDPDLAEAIMLVENVQRPLWLRQIERLVGPLIGVRTYGVMQVRSSRPLSDEESVRIAVSDHLAKYASDIGDSVHEYQRVMEAVRRYNGNPHFVDMVIQVYDEIQASED